MAMGFFLCLGYLTAGVEIFDFRFCGRANVVVSGHMGDIGGHQVGSISPLIAQYGHRAGFVCVGGAPS